MHLWLKYILILPLFCALIIVVLKGVFMLSGIDYLQHFGNLIELYVVNKDQLLTYSLLQGIFFIGCIAFKRQKMISAFIVVCLCLTIMLGLTALMTICAPADSHGYWMSNIIAYPIYNFPVSPTGEAIIAFCNYATPPLFIIGTWVSVYFLLKEKQL